MEIIHAYSLVHDDLPAMDDDDLRRGQPICHVAFGEAMAIRPAMRCVWPSEILAADTAPVRGMPRRAYDAGLLAAAACGGTGMAGGQALDLAAVGQVLSPAEPERMRALHKTGALIAGWCSSVPRPPARC